MDSKSNHPHTNKHTTSHTTTAVRCSRAVQAPCRASAKVECRLATALEQPAARPVPAPVGHLAHGGSRAAVTCVPPPSSSAGCSLSWPRHRPRAAGGHTQPGRPHPGERRNPNVAAAGTSAHAAVARGGRTHVGRTPREPPGRAGCTGRRLGAGRAPSHGAGARTPPPPAFASKRRLSCAEPARRAAESGAGVVPVLACRTVPDSHARKSQR